MHWGTKWLGSTSKRGRGQVAIYADRIEAWESYPWGTRPTVPTIIPVRSIASVVISAGRLIVHAGGRSHDLAASGGRAVEAQRLILQLTDRQSDGSGRPPPPVVPPAGWYPDPELAAEFRWWDGRRWTGNSQGHPPRR
jgi:hypothetical protein